MTTGLKSGEDTSPNVSVVIPCTRPNLVQGTLAGLLAQDYPPDKIEVILVGSTRVKEEVSGCGYTTKFVNAGDTHTPGKARNMGARVAGGDVLIFLDDDCEPAPFWVFYNVAELTDPSVGAVSGRITGRPASFFSRCADYSDYYMYQSMHREERNTLDSSSLGIRKNVFFDVGGFDEDLQVGEDMEFARRVAKKGYKLVYQPKVHVFHNHGRDTLWKLLRHSYRWGRNVGYSTEEKSKRCTKNSLFSRVLSQKNLFLLVLMVPVFCFYNTLQAVSMNFGYNKQVIVYAPFILLSQLVYFCGVFVWLLKRG